MNDAPRPRAAIIAIGSELLNGDGLDTNSQWLSRRLERLGFQLSFHLSCLDDEADIVAALAFAHERVDVIVTTGGLGPTNDDLTRQAVATFLGVELAEDAGSVTHIEALFASFSRTMPESNRRQALIPVGAEVLQNDVGTAPGFRAERDGTAIYVIPGPPREVLWMWDHRLFERLRDASGVIRAERTFRAAGIGESKLAELLAPLEADPALEVRYAAEEQLGTIRVTILTEGQDRAQEAWLEANRLAGPFVAAQGNDLLAEAVAALLHARGLTVATAESCTGGRVAASLVEIPGTSAIFGESYVTYSNEAKQRLLGVPAEVLEAHGAVSVETAHAMAKGVRRAAGADLGVGITGIAGPGGGSAEKPVGLVHIAVAGPGDDDLRHFARQYPGDRHLVQVRAAAGALNLLRQALEATTPVR